MTIGNGYTDKTMSEAEVREIVTQAFAAHDMTGKRVLFITPDATRSGPMDVMFRVFHETIGSVKKLIAIAFEKRITAETQLQNGECVIGVTRSSVESVHKDEIAGGVCRAAEAAKHE